MSTPDAMLVWLDHAKSAMRAENIDADTVARVLNRLKFGDPRGDIHARVSSRCQVCGHPVHTERLEVTSVVQASRGQEEFVDGRSICTANPEHDPFLIGQVPKLPTVRDVLDGLPEGSVVTAELGVPDFERDETRRSST